MWLKNVAFALLICPLDTACFSEPFQPPTADADLWEKPGANRNDVLASMLVCCSRNKFLRNSSTLHPSSLPWRADSERSGHHT